MYHYFGGIGLRSCEEPDPALMKFHLPLPPTSAINRVANTALFLEFNFPVAGDGKSYKEYASQWGIGITELEIDVELRRPDGTITTTQKTVYIGIHCRRDRFVQQLTVKHTLSKIKCFSICR